MNDGYSICLNRWALDESIKNELRLLLIISSLTAEKGYCYASNKYLAEQFNETEQSISNKIKKLEKSNYIEIEYEKRGCEIKSRKIRLKNFYTHDIKTFISTIEKDFKENNTSINNNINNIYKHFENIFVRTLNGIEAQMIENWLKDKTEEQIINAINECAKSNIDNLKYIEKVLYGKKKKKTTPEWFNKEIESSEIEDNTEFNNFLEDFRNAK